MYNGLNSSIKLVHFLTKSKSYVLGNILGWCIKLWTKRSGCCLWKSQLL